jgi:acetolactate decarboxylase
MKAFAFLKAISVSLAIFSLGSSFAVAQERNEVKVTGAMRNVMWKGELAGLISTDTLNKEGVYGIGPIENLTGEILIINGKTFTSRVQGTSIVVDSNVKVAAPFFVHTEVKEWKEIKLPEQVNSIKELEAFLVEFAGKKTQPFVFRLQGVIHWSQIHVVNLPKGSIVKSPEDAHLGRESFYISDMNSTIIGFFSRSHQGVFTHHDSFLHMHLLTGDGSMMGHVDELKFSSSVKLFIQAR